MAEYIISTNELRCAVDKLRAGDRVLLSGTVYTMRDAAHKKVVDLLDNNISVPFDLNGSVIYYAGPTPTPDNLPIGSCGPTTSSRMDVFTPKLLDLGMSAIIGKGPRSKEVCESITKNKAVYFCAVGGAGALAAECIKNCQVIAFEELGCESIKKLEFENFPLVVGIDANGGNLFMGE